MPWVTSLTPASETIILLTVRTILLCSQRKQQCVADSPIKHAPPPPNRAVGGGLGRGKGGQTAVGGGLGRGRGGQTEVVGDGLGRGRGGRTEAVG